MIDPQSAHDLMGTGARFMEIAIFNKNNNMMMTNTIIITVTAADNSSPAFLTHFLS